MLNQFNVSLWGDEAFSATLSLKSVPEIIKIIIKDTSPPLYNILEHFWFQIFGTSEIAIRALSFLFFCLAVFFVFKIGEYLWGKKTGLLAAFLTFFNPFFFIYAFEGRMYSLLALGVTASMYFFLKRNWFAYCLATAVALYSHHFAIFAVFVQFIWLGYEFFLGKRKQARAMLKAFLIVGLLYLPWLYPLYKQVTMVGSGFWLATPTLADLRNLIYEFLAEGIKNPIIEIPFIHRSLGQIALYLTFIVLLLRRWTKDIKKSLFLLSWFLIPIFTTWLISQKFTSIFYNRYLLYTIPAIALILASRLNKASAAVAGILLLCFGIIDINYFTHPAKRPFRQMAAYVKEIKRGDDILLNWNSAAHHLWEAKYYQIPAPLYLPNAGKLPYFVGTALMGKEDFVSSLPKDSKTRKINRLGVITSGEVAEVILPGYTKGEVKTFGELKFIWFLKIR